MILLTDKDDSLPETAILPSAPMITAPPFLRRTAFTVSYDGRWFHGWQRQGEDRTVQATIEEALTRLVGVPLTVVGSGRTDAGVSAHGQVFHLDLPESQHHRWTPESLRKGANHFLPKEIRLLSSADVGPTFHARHSVRKKIYRYRFRIIPANHTPSPLDNPFTGVFAAPVDLDLFRMATHLFSGHHDFTHFTVRKSLPPRTDRTIDDLFFEQIGTDHQIWITGKGFLHMMIRFMVGSMIEVAKGKRSLAELGSILLPGAPPPGKALKPAPPEGLSLIRVLYGEMDPFL